MSKKARADKLRATFLTKGVKVDGTLADVEIEVKDVLTGDKRVFQTIRGLCAAMSPVLKEMLSATIADGVTPKLKISDCRVQGVEWMLAYFYGLEPAITIDNVVSVLKCADRFLLDELENECLAFITEEGEDIDEMLPIASEIERMKLDSIPALKTAMETLLANSHFTATAVEEPNFAKSPAFVVDAVVRSDGLPIAEEKLWQLVVVWAKEQWAEGRRPFGSEEVGDDSKEPDAGTAETGAVEPVVAAVAGDSGATESLGVDWRHLLRPFIPFFRFPLMDQTFFCAEVVPLGLLSEKEALSVIMAQKVAGSHCDFSAVPRAHAALATEILCTDEFDALKEKAAAACGVDFGTCKLLFRATDHGFDAAAFHRLCDDKGPTLTVAITEFGHVIGGYTNVPWMSAGGRHVADAGAWLFVSRVNESRKAKYASITLPAILGANPKNKNQVYHHSGNGPTFGNGTDLLIANNCNLNTSSYCNVGYGFVKVCEGTTLKPKSITGGKKGYAFRVVNYEVFSVA